MSDMKHTPEPWHEWAVSGGNPIYISGADEAGVCMMDGPLDRRAADAARIIACVNPLAGTDDPAALLRECRQAVGELLEVLSTGTRDLPAHEYAAIRRGAIIRGHDLLAKLPKE